MSPFFRSIAACALAMGMSMAMFSQAYAFNCSSPDSEVVKEMYEIYLQSGKTPVAKVQTITPVNKSLKINAHVIGLGNYEECWKEKPPCDDEAEIIKVTVELVSSVEEITKRFNGRTDTAALDCFMKIGASGKYKAK